MTENKKKATEKEVDEKFEGAPKQIKKVKLKEVIDNQDDQSESLEAGDPLENEESNELEKVGVTVEDYQLGSVEKKGKKPKDIESETEVIFKSTRNVTPQEFDWDAFESDELRNSPKYKEYENLYDETLSTVAVDEVASNMLPC
jgi:hypothetical protein